MIRTIIQQDWWLIRQSNLYKIIGIVFIGCLIIATMNGRRIYHKQLQTHTAIDSTAKALPQQLKAHLQQIERNNGQFEGESFFDPRLPYAVGNRYAPRFVVYPLQPLTQWSIGQSDIYPTYYRVTAAKMQSLLVNEEIANPQIQFTGYFDVAFVLVYLLPLLIIGFTYNLTARENELGTLRMLLSEPVSFQKIIAVKFVFRFLLASIFLWLVFFIMGMINGIPMNNAWMRFVAGAWWYLLFWFALSWCINAASSKQSGTTAGVLVGSWLAFVLLVPGVINLVAGAKYPMPSRIDLITETREASASISKKSSAVLGKYLQDHPDLVKDTAGMNPNDFAVKSFTAVVETEKMVAPLENSFESQLQHQQQLAAKLGYGSPAMQLQSWLNATAATHEDYFAGFKKHVQQFFKLNREYFTKRIIGQKKFSSQEVDGIPLPDTYKPARQSGGGQAIYFFVLSVILVIAGMLTFRFGRVLSMR